METNATETKTTETPLFIMESELTIFRNRHPEYEYAKRVYYEDKTLAGYLMYKSV